MKRLKQQIRFELWSLDMNNQLGFAKGPDLEALREPLELWLIPG
jgi:hypothetical protein